MFDEVFQFKDVTVEAITIKSALARAIEDTEADGGTPTPLATTSASPAPSSAEELEGALYDLIVNEKWSNCVSFIKQHRGQLNGECETYTENDNDVSVILNVYCKKFVQDRPGMLSDLWLIRVVKISLTLLKIILPSFLLIMTRQCGLQF